MLSLAFLYFLQLGSARRWRCGGRHAGVIFFPHNLGTIVEAALAQTSVFLFGQLFLDRQRVPWMDRVAITDGHCDTSS